MAGAKTGKAAADALAAYRRTLISDDIETRIAELSEAVAVYTAHREDRAERERALAQRQNEDEDAVLAAFDAAKDAGAKSAALAQIGLRPDSVLAAARARLPKQSPAPGDSTAPQNGHQVHPVTADPGTKGAEGVPAHERTA